MPLNTTQPPKRQRPGRHSLASEQRRRASLPLAVRRIAHRFGVPVETAFAIAEHAGFALEARV